MDTELSKNLNIEIGKKLFAVERERLKLMQNLVGEDIDWESEEITDTQAERLILAIPLGMMAANPQITIIMKEMKARSDELQQLHDAKTPGDLGIG